nr:LOW QUALITY PROTEIN: uncharacterized protein LOC123756142 [Procambarus clarkii]
MEVLIRELSSRPLSLRQLEECLGPHLPKKQMSGDLPWVEITKRLVNRAIDTTSEILLSNVSKIIENNLKTAVRRGLKYPNRNGRNYCNLLSSLITHVHLAVESSELSGAEVNRLISLLLAAVIDTEVVSVRSGKEPATISRISVKLNIMLGHCEERILDTLLHCRTLIYKSARQPQIFVPLITRLLSSVKDRRALSAQVYLKYLLLAKLLLFMTKKEEIIQTRKHIVKSVKLPETFADWAVQNKIPWLKLKVWSTRLILKHMKVAAALKTLFNDEPTSVLETGSQNPKKEDIIDFPKASDDGTIPNDCGKAKKKINKNTSGRIHEEVANSKLNSKQIIVQNTGIEQESLNDVLTIHKRKCAREAAFRTDTKECPKVENMPTSNARESQQEVDNKKKELLDVSVKGKERKDGGSVGNKENEKDVGFGGFQDTRIGVKKKKKKKNRRSNETTVEIEKHCSDTDNIVDSQNVRVAKGTDTSEVQENVITSRKKIKLPDVAGSVGKYTSNVDVVVNKKDNVILGKPLSTEVKETRQKKRKRKKLSDTTMEKCPSDADTKLDKKENGGVRDGSDLHIDEKRQGAVVKTKKRKWVDSIVEDGKNTHDTDILDDIENVKLRKKLDIGICMKQKKLKKKNEEPDVTVAEERAQDAITCTKENIISKFLGTDIHETENEVAKTKKKKQLSNLILKENKHATDGHSREDKRGNIKVDKVAGSEIYETQQDGVKTKKRKKLRDRKLEKYTGDTNTEADMKENVKVRKTFDLSSDDTQQKLVKIYKKKWLLDNVKAGKHTNDDSSRLSKTINIQIGKVSGVDETQAVAVKTKTHKRTLNKTLEEVHTNDADNKRNSKGNRKMKWLSNIDMEEGQKVVAQRKNMRTVTDVCDKTVKDSECQDGAVGDEKDVTVKDKKGMKMGQLKNVKRAHLEVEGSLSVKKKKKINTVVDTKLGKWESFAVKRKCKKVKNTETSGHNIEAGTSVEMPACEDFHRHETKSGSTHPANLFASKNISLQVGHVKKTHGWDEVHPHFKSRVRTLSDPVQDTKSSFNLPRVRRLSDQLTERRKMLMETGMRTPSDEKGQTFKLNKRKLASLRQKIRRNSINFTVTNLEPRSPQNRLNVKCGETSKVDELIEKEASLRKDSSQENRYALAVGSSDGGELCDVVAGGKPCDVVAGGKPCDVVAGGKPCDVVAGGKPCDVVAGGKPCDEVPDEIHSCDIEVPDNLDSNDCILLNDTHVRSDLSCATDSCINEAFDNLDKYQLDSSKADSDVEEIKNEARDTSVSINKEIDLKSNYLNSKGSEVLVTDESENVKECQIVDISEECPTPPPKGIEDPDSEVEILDEAFVVKSVQALTLNNEASDVDEASGTDSDIIPCDETAKMFTDEEIQIYHTKLKEDEIQRKVEDILKEEDRELKQKMIKDEILNDTNAEEETDTNKNLSDPDPEIEKKVGGPVDFVSKMINKLYKPAIGVERSDDEENSDLESSSDDGIEVILQTIVKDTGRLTSIDGLRERFTGGTCIKEELGESDGSGKNEEVQGGKTLENGHSSDEKSSVKGSDIVVLSNENFAESNNQETETVDKNLFKVSKDQEPENMDREKSNLSKNQNIELCEVVIVANQIVKEANENMKLENTENDEQLASHSSSQEELTDHCLNNNENVNVSRLPNTKMQNQDVERDCRNLIVKLEGSDKSELPTEVKPTGEESLDVCKNQRDVCSFSQKKTSIEDDAVIDIITEVTKNEDSDGYGDASFEEGKTKFEAEFSSTSNPDIEDVKSELTNIPMSNSYQQTSRDENHVSKGSVVDAPNSVNDPLCCPIMEPLQISDDSLELSIYKVETDTTLSKQIDAGNSSVRSNVFGCSLGDDRPNNNDDRTTNGELESITEESEGKSIEGADEAYEASSDASEDPTPKVRKRARLLKRNLASHGILQEASDSDASPIQRTRRRRLSEVAGNVHLRPRKRSQSWCQETSNLVSGSSVAVQTCLSESAVDGKKCTKSSGTVDPKTHNESDCKKGRAFCSSSNKQNSVDTSSVKAINLLNTMSSSSSMSSESVMGSPVKDVDCRTIKDVMDPELQDSSTDSLVAKVRRSSRQASKLASHLQSHSENVELSCISSETLEGVADKLVSVSLNQNLDLENDLASESKGSEIEGDLGSEIEQSGTEGDLPSENEHSGIVGDLPSENIQSGVVGDLASENKHTEIVGDLASESKQSGIEGDLASENKQSGVESESLKSDHLDFGLDEISSESFPRKLKASLPQRREEKDQSGFINKIEGELTAEQEINQSGGAGPDKTSDIGESKTASEQLDEGEIHTIEGEILDDSREGDREYFDEEEGEELEVLSTSGTDENDETTCCHYLGNVGVSDRDKTGVPTTQMMLRSLLRRRSSKTKTKSGTLDIVKRGDIHPSIPHLKVHCVSEAVLTKEVLISPEVSDEECELVSPGLNDANGAKSFPIPESLATSPKKIPSPITTPSRGPRKNSGGIRSPQKVIPEEQDETTLPNGTCESVPDAPNTPIAKAHCSLALQDKIKNKYSCSTSDKSTLTRQLSKTALELPKSPKSPVRSKASSSSLEISTDSPKRKSPSMKSNSQVENVAQERSVTKVNRGRKSSSSEDLQNILETDDSSSPGHAVRKSRRSKLREPSGTPSVIEGDSDKSVLVNVGSPEKILIDSADKTCTVSEDSSFSKSNFASEELIVTGRTSFENDEDTKVSDGGLQELNEERDDLSTNTKNDSLVHLNARQTESAPEQNSSGSLSGSSTGCSSPLRRSTRLRTSVRIPPLGAKKKSVGVTHNEKSTKEEVTNKVNRESKSSTAVSENVDELSSKSNVSLITKTRSHVSVVKSSSRTDGVPTNISPKNELPAGSTSEEEKSKVKSANSSIGSSPRLHKSVMLSSSCRDESSGEIMSRNEVPVRLFSLKVLLDKSEVAPVSPSGNCSHTESSQASAQVPVSSKKDGSPDALSFTKGRSPGNSSSSKGKSPGNSSFTKGRSPGNSSSSKGKSPGNSSFTKGRSPGNSSSSMCRSPGNSPSKNEFSNLPSSQKSPLTSSLSKYESLSRSSSSYNTPAKSPSSLKMSLRMVYKSETPDKLSSDENDIHSGSSLKRSRKPSRLSLSRYESPVSLKSPAISSLSKDESFSASSSMTGANSRPTLSKTVTPPFPSIMNKDESSAESLSSKSSASSSDIGGKSESNDEGGAAVVGVRSLRRRQVTYSVNKKNLM